MVFKQWEDVTVNEKFMSFIIYVNEIKIIRFPIIITERLIKELFISKKQPQDLIYKKLIPDYDFEDLNVQFNTYRKNHI